MTDSSHTPTDGANAVFDIAIVGAGPTGLFGAFYAGLRGMSVLLIDSLDVLGGQLTTLYPEKYIYDVAGFPKVLAKDLVAQLVEQAMHANPTIALGQQVSTLEQDEASGLYTIHTADTPWRAKTIVLAAGVGAFQPKTLALPNAAEYRGRGLHYFVKTIATFRDQRLLIVGGGDSAVDWANALAGVAADVTLIHRRDQFRAHEHAVAQMRQGPTRIHTFHELKAIGGSGKIEHAIVYDNRTKDEKHLVLDAVLVNIGFVSSLGPLAHWGLNVEGGQISVDSMMQTNRPGIFAAGDVTTYPGKLKLIATGFGEAATAINYAKHFLDPKANIFPGHSSNMKG
jgi:thioredoxin reductase (NADPH)